MVHLRYVHVVAILLFWMAYVLLIQSTTGVLTRGIIHELLALTGPMLAYGIYRRWELIPLKFYLPVYLVTVIALLVGWESSTPFGMIGFIIAGVNIPTLLCILRTVTDGKGSLVVGSIVISLILVIMGIGQNDLSSTATLVMVYTVIAVAIDAIGDVWHGN